MSNQLKRKKLIRILAIALVICTACAMSLPVSVMAGGNHGLSYGASAAKENKNAQMGQSIKKLKTGKESGSKHAKDVITVDSAGTASDGENERELFIGFQKGYLRGIDISCWQGKISDESWKKIADEVDFVIIRCGYGLNTRSRDDSTFEANTAACEKYGIPYGVYLYSYADSVAKAQNEAEHCLRLLKNKEPQYPVYYDMEDDVVASAGSAVIQQMASTFCQEITDNGYRAGVYASLSWWQTKLGNSVDDYSKWSAEWSSSCSYDCDIWQCADNGQLSGLSGSVDINELMIPEEDMETYMEGAHTSFTGKAHDVENYEAFVKVNTAKLKSGPGLGYETKGTIKKGTKVCVSEIYNGYAHIISSDMESIEQLQGGLDEESVSDEQIDSDAGDNWILLSAIARSDSAKEWEQTADGKKLVNYDGSYATGVVKFGNYYYGFDEEGNQYIGEKVDINGKRYAFDSKGRAVRCVVKVNKKTNLRKGPGKKYKKKGKLKKGETVNVIRGYKAWYMTEDGLWFKRSDAEVVGKYPSEDTAKEEATE